VLIDRGQIQLHLGRHYGWQTESENPCTLIGLKLKNTSADKKVEYTPWGGGQLGVGSMAKLTDDIGNRYRQVSFPFGVRVKHSVEHSVSIYPGAEPTEDMLVFQVPVPSAKTLLIELPGENVRAEKSVRFKVPMPIVLRPKP
jgi:hypothetical protein